MLDIYLLKFYYRFVHHKCSDMDVATFGNCGYVEISHQCLSIDTSTDSKEQLFQPNLCIILIAFWNFHYSSCSYNCCHFQLVTIYIIKKLSDMWCLCLTLKGPIVSSIFLWSLFFLFLICDIKQGLFHVIPTNNLCDNWHSIFHVFKRYIFSTLNLQF